MVERLTEVCACLSVEYLPEAVGPAIPATDGFPFSESVWRPRWRCRACEVEFVKATVVDELRAEFSALQAKWLKADDVAQEADARQQIEKIRDAVTRTGRKDKTPWAIVDDVIAILDAAEPALSGGGESLTPERVDAIMAYAQRGKADLHRYLSGGVTTGELSPGPAHPGRDVDRDAPTYVCDVCACMPNIGGRHSLACPRHPGVVVDELHPDPTRCQSTSPLFPDHQCMLRRGHGGRCGSGSGRRWTR